MVENRNNINNTPRSLPCLCGFSASSSVAVVVSLEAIQFEFKLGRPSMGRALNLLPGARVVGLARGPALTERRIVRLHPGPAGIGNHKNMQCASARRLESADTIARLMRARHSRPFFSNQHFLPGQRAKNDLSHVASDGGSGERALVCQDADTGKHSARQAKSS
jgi:hypothetical protein